MLARLFSLCALITLIAATAALAQRSILVETRDSNTPNGKPACALVINGTVVARLAKPTVIGGIERTPQRGLALAAAVLAEAYRGGAPNFTITTSPDGRARTVKVNGQPLLVASDLEGKAWGVTPQALATTWQQNIESSLTGVSDIELAPAVQEAVAEARREPRPKSDPLPTVQQDSALLYEDEVPASKPITTQPKPASKPPTATPKPAAKPTQTKPGVTKPDEPEPVRIPFGSASLAGPTTRLAKAYEPPQRATVEAITTPPQFTAVVTGTSPSPAMLKTAVESAIRTGAALPDDSTVTWRASDEEFVLPALTPGTKLSVPSVYKVGADTQLTPFTLTLENRSIPAARESVTFFSNVPENLKKEQLLYHAELPARQAARLVFHHQNQMRGKLRFVARVVNTSGQPAGLHVTPGDTPPNLNTFFVGFKSAESFWSNLVAGQGFVLRVPAGGQAWIIGQVLDPGYTASGYYRLTNVSGSPLHIETLALQPETAAPRGLWPSKADASFGVYPTPYVTTTHEYNANAGAPWLYLRLGEDAPPSHTDDTVHFGSYGVTHTYEVTVRNAKQSPALVFIVLRGSAGEVKGQFFFDDQYISTALVKGGEEQELMELPLKPGESRKLRIKAIALNGGFYPASIILREERITIRYEK